MPLETYSKYAYQSLCSQDEIERIFNVDSSSDYLLKLRANATVEHTRIHRVFLSRMRRYEADWSFENYFDRTPFRNYINCLEEKDYVVADKFPAGFVFCDSPNGQIISTKFGNIITISESLRYFLYYMSLGFLEFEEIEIPMDVKWAAIVIAIRIMLRSEALDFDLDPRGDIPELVHNELELHIDAQLQFVIGHEFSHHFLGHLDKGMLVESSLLSSLTSPSFKEKRFSYDQRDELAADIDAIERPIYTPATKASMLNNALFFFVYIDIYADIKEQISPSHRGLKSHPNPMDRFHNLLDHFDGTVDFDKSNWETLLDIHGMYKKKLKEEVALNIDCFEFYGSVYLGSWRGKVLMDRVDF